MKVGASISGIAHTGLVVFAIWGVDWFSAKDPEPLTIAEIELVDGTDFEAALSAAPVVPSDGPSELSEPSELRDLPSEVEQPVDESQSAKAPVLSQADAPDAQPEKPEISFPAPPTEIPTEAPVPSIAEIPSPDSLNRQAAEPESPNATEPQRAVAAIQAPLPSQKPNRPPDPEPEPALDEPEPERETATLVAQGPEPSEAPTEVSAAESESPATDPLQPLASVGTPSPDTRPDLPAEPEAESRPSDPSTPKFIRAPVTPEEEQPETAAEEQPDRQEDSARPEQVETANPKPEAPPLPEPPDPEVAEEEEAPEGPAPRIAKLPVARPADKAAAAIAARETEQAPKATEVAENKPSESTEPAKPTGSTAVQAPKLSRGERDALRVGIKKYYVYNGDRSDKSLRVIIRVKLDEQGQLIGKPSMRSASGGTDTTQRALFNAGRRAVVRAASAGEFRRLPADKYERWKVLNFRFSTDKVGFSS